MTASVFLLVLLGAALHATWNAIVKRGTDKLLTTVLVVSSSGAVAAAVLPFLPLPAPAAWPFLAASASVQVLYLAIVAGAYRAADMSLAYPLMRGLAPALVAAFGMLWLGETLSPAAWIGIGLICGGVFGTAIAVRGHASRRGVALALANAAVIATYTLIDGVGVRVSGAPVSYTLWLFLLNAIPLLGWALLFRRRAFLAYLRGGPADRRCRRPRQPRLLRPRALGDDRRADRAGRRAPRDIDPLRRGDRSTPARRAHRPRPTGRLRHDRARRRQPARGLTLRTSSSPGQHSYASFTPARGIPNGALTLRGTTCRRHLNGTGGRSDARRHLSSARRGGLSGAGRGGPRHRAAVRHAMFETVLGLAVALALLVYLLAALLRPDRF